jgi:uncharacterized protein (DUF486 family)
MDLAFFYQTTDEVKKSGYLTKLYWSELWATFEWMFVIPANRIGNLFLSAPQLSLSSYFFNFIGQIVTNKYWLNLPITIDDYFGMILILIGMYISSYKIFG